MKDGHQRSHVVVITIGRDRRKHTTKVISNSVKVVVIGLHFVVS